MGIRTPCNPTGQYTFSEDVLKNEKCGPNEDYLTVNDVPGIFRTTTEDIATENDKAMVRNMVIEYIKDPSTIILAVLPANVDVATQEILALAAEYDKAGERTLGILTKPDLLKERSAKATVCELVLGNCKALNLGYYIVRSGTAGAMKMRMTRSWPSESSCSASTLGVSCLMNALGSVPSVCVFRSCLVKSPIRPSPPFEPS